MLENDIIELYNSEWSSPCLLVPKLNGTKGFSVDYFNLNIPLLLSIPSSSHFVMVISLFGK